MEKRIKLTVLSFGGGQDSTAILYRIIGDPEFRDRWVQGGVIVVMSDTGNEHPHTYRHIAFIEQLCREHAIEFHFLRSRMGYHPRTWPTLQHQFRRNRVVMSLAYPRTCTDNLKIKPIYNFLDHYVAKRYFGYTDPVHPKGKRYLKQFAREFGPIRILLGIAAGEEHRVAAQGKKALKKMQLDLFKQPRPIGKSWMDWCLDKAYPLIDAGMDRAACQAYIRSVGLPLPFPSNCMMCPFASKAEILWLYRKMPAQFRKWVAFEQAKLDKCAGTAKRNLGVKGEQSLEAVLAEAIAEFGHLSDAELETYKMSHGHCVRSSY